MKHTITYAFVALLLAITGMAKAQQWTEIHTGVSEALYNVCCIDANTVFVCGQNGVILKSTDGGENWMEKFRRTDWKMIDIYFANPDIGYAVCDSTLDYNSHLWFLVKTIDGGETWNEVGEPNLSESFTYSSNKFVRTELCLIDNNNLVVAVSFDGIYKSTDGGQTMRKLTNDFTINETRGFFFEDNVGYLIWNYVADYPEDIPAGVAKTEDFGETWSLIENVSDITEGFVFSHFYDKNHIRLFGAFQDDKGILETNDGFDFFNTTNVTFYEYYNAAEMYLRAKFTKNGYGVWMLWEDDWGGVGRGIAYTEDDGDTWKKYSPYGIPSFRMYDIDGIDTTFFISSAGGKVLKNSQFTLMNTEEFSSQPVCVYPNPTADKVFINIEPAVEPETSSPVHIELTGADGRVIMQTTALGNNVTLDLDNLSPGIYVLSVKGNAFLHRQTIIKTD